MHKDEDDSQITSQTSARDFPDSAKNRPRPRPLSPLRSVTVIAESGPKEISIKEISPETIGCKGYGLTSIPAEWTPPFLVVTASCLEESLSDQEIDGWIMQCCDVVGIGAGCQVMVRSSGTLETMQKRGQSISRSCSISEVLTTIRSLTPELAKILGGTVHWIVQEYIKPRQKGLLSNERRLRKEKRDWVAEFELPAKRRSPTESFAVRQWRDGTDTTKSDLRCAADFEITLRLRDVAKWATLLSSRTLFEWVWDGKKVHIVQADVAEPAKGIDPRSLLKTQLSSVRPASLQVFRLANQLDYERYGKLRNAKLYEELGYSMPIFYVIDDPRVVKAILCGQISTGLQEDFAELTKRPLIIRTDGISIRSGQSEMLPRSDELRSSGNAVGWLVTDFRSKVDKSGLRNSGLCLIAHHFIPSVASAWARAVPGERTVRIESLWGIPEGLYWHSHDTFEVDTQTVDLGSGPSTASLKYKVRERLRHKGTFFAANDDGKWEPRQTRPPYDWNKSVSKRTWLFEIAHTTRRVAEREKCAVSVMWFIDNHPEASKHKVLPWFHSRSELGSPMAAPRQKRKDARDFTINKVDDWQQLQKDLQSGKHLERVVVEPTEPALIRNYQFAKALASLAASNNFVVELSGGILSHVYHILQSHGAQVECVDLFGADEEIVDYNKIVRDNIPNVIEGRGESVKTVKLKGDALRTALLQKLVEEAFEALDANSAAELIGELADVKEVIKALCEGLKVTADDIEAERKEKENRRGGFEKGLMLVKTSTPHSIQKQSTTADLAILELRSEESSTAVISEAADLPVKSLYRRSDLRRVDRQPEKLFTFETEISKVREIETSLNFSMPIDDQVQRDFSLRVELRRKRTSVRGDVRIRLLPSQLRIEFSEQNDEAHGKVKK